MFLAIGNIVVANTIYLFTKQYETSMILEKEIKMEDLSWIYFKH